jgi:hypothetical protein
VAVRPDPPRVGPAQLALTLADAAGAPLAGGSVQLEATMAHAGMQPVFATAKEIAPGRYEAALEFTMGGDWFLIVTAAFPDGRKLERQVPLPGVRSGE